MMEQKHSLYLTKPYDIDINNIFRNNIVLFVSILFYNILIANEKQQQAKSNGNTKRQYKISTNSSDPQFPWYCSSLQDLCCKNYPVPAKQNIDKMKMETVDNDSPKSTTNTIDHGIEQESHSSVMPTNSRTKENNTRSNELNVFSMKAIKVKQCPCLLYLYCFEDKYSLSRMQCHDFKNKESVQAESQMDNINLVDHGRYLVTNKSNWETSFVSNYSLLNKYQQFGDSNLHNISSRASSTLFLTVYCFQINNVTNDSTSLQVIQCFDVVVRRQAGLKMYADMKVNSSEEFGKTFLGYGPKMDTNDRLTFIFNVSLTTPSKLPNNMPIEKEKLNNKAWTVYETIVATFVVTFAIITVLKIADVVFTSESFQSSHHKQKIKFEEEGRGIREQHKKRRLQRQSELNERAQGHLLGIISSLTESTQRETDGYNEWLDTPD